ncbi:hypothetical protein Murru_2613 [Allomuricauda ruestringensis DSM 13258]|uniref:Cytochrome c domain-containing protein n=1 Tax=Allomuricauda ruestringensis (strain DSM 13258 / CIP 107369 / LMG 19739 / B1) TaxID=886377 RepID=G2PQL1_ALLRU|nr:hypothetical protein [Allomuricauda ruestringensis]AEM71648.1 hypothetical protein Murru_2613 [Allomuricauda ruestringensis DSM 13258]
MKNVLTVFVFAFLFLLSCSNDSESDLTGPQTGNENEFVTYNDNIKAVISNNCLSCHSSPPTNGAPFSLTTYTQVKNRAENGSLLAAISKQTGEAGAMPPTGRMPQATIDLVEQWIADGLLED